DFSREVFVAFNQQGSSISGGAEPGTISFAKGEFVFRLVYYPPGPGVRSLDAFYSEGFLFAVRRDMLKKMTFETYRAPNLKTPIIKMTHVLKLHRSKRLNVQ
ncbi:hypothetical protein KKF84_22545, partial [Myxococcota bacterium]|nr:hypothetical protein [Myxococcota bacterium]MBU1538109.1 hypothetical protein [Myxococcota bacterium]